MDVLDTQFHRFNWGSVAVEPTLGFPRVCPWGIDGIGDCDGLEVGASLLTTETSLLTWTSPFERDLVSVRRGVSDLTEDRIASEMIAVLAICNFP